MTGLSPTEEQRLLADAVSRLLGDHYDFAARRRHAAAPEGWSRDIWARFADLGLLGLPFAEADGGFGGGGMDLLVVMEAFGRALVLEPYLASVVLAGGAVRRAGDAAQRAAILPRIAAGRLVMGFAHAEPAARHRLRHVETGAHRDGSAWRLNGAKTLVLNGDSAEMLVVSARLSGMAEDPDGLGLFLLDPAAQGVSRRGYTLLYGSRACELGLDDARADAALGAPGGAGPVIAQVIDEAIAALAAEAVGAMAAAQALTIEHLKTRRQFGRPIGQNQALQHKAVDMLIALEQARSMALLAAFRSGPAAWREVAAAKVQIGTAARLIGEGAVQLHGGIGMTEEYAVGHYLRRLMVIEQLFGDTACHLGRLAG